MEIPAATAVPVAIEAAKLEAQAVREILAWARQPFFSDTKTTTRSWTEIDKKGKAHTLTETKTKGFSISNGLVLGVGAIVLAWEVGMSLNKALSGWNGGSLTKDAYDVLNAPSIIGQDVFGAVNAIASFPVNAANAVWDWLDGQGPVHNAPPASTVKTTAMPASAMAALNQVFSGILSPVASGAQSIGQKLSSAIQNASSGPTASPTA